MGAWARALPSVTASAGWCKKGKRRSFLSNWKPPPGAGPAVPRVQLGSPPKSTPLAIIDPNTQSEVQVESPTSASTPAASGEPAGDATSLTIWLLGEGSVERDLEAQRRTMAALEGDRRVIGEPIGLLDMPAGFLRGVREELAGSPGDVAALRGTCRQLRAAVEPLEGDRVDYSTIEGAAAGILSRLVWGLDHSGAPRALDPCGVPWAFHLGARSRDSECI